MCWDSGIGGGRSLHIVNEAMINLCGVGIVSRPATVNNELVCDLVFPWDEDRGFETGEMREARKTTVGNVVQREREDEKKTQWLSQVSAKQKAKAKGERRGQGDLPSRKSR